MSTVACPNCGIASKVRQYALTVLPSVQMCRCLGCGWKWNLEDTMEVRPEPGIGYVILVILGIASVMVLGALLFAVKAGFTP